MVISIFITKVHQFSNKAKKICLNSEGNVSHPLQPKSNANLLGEMSLHADMKEFNIASSKLTHTNLNFSKFSSVSSNVTYIKSQSELYSREITFKNILHLLFPLIYERLIHLLQRKQRKIKDLFPKKLIHLLQRKQGKI